MPLPQGKNVIAHGGQASGFWLLVLFYELAENTRDFNHEMNRLRTKRVF
ncbi:hypothetical protein C2W64_00432 [Brevibacillus laterosporus]|nr:hypothetical protein C2W64_00432 [Brevibacillus laterosporus]